MEAFVRVCDAGGFSEAARRWGKSKAVVSKYVLQLETYLGAQLLQRSTRSIGQTDAGQRYYEKCVEVLADVESLEADIRAERSRLRGTLTVAAPPGFTSQRLEALTTSFIQAHPDVQLDLRLSNRMVDLVAEGIDVAVRLTEPTDSALIAKRLGRVRLVVVASPEYLRTRGEPTHPRELKEHACIVDTNFRDQQRWRFRVDGRRVQVSVRGPVRVDNPLVVRDLVCAGQGVAISPFFVVEDELERGDLVEVLAGTVGFEWGIYAIYPRRKHLPARVRAYVDHLARELRFD